MNIFFNSFSNREISIVLWSLIIILVMFFLNVKGAINLIKAFFAKKLVYIYLLMTLYLISVLFILKYFRLWDLSLLKDFLFWLFTSAFVMLLNFNKLNKNKDFKSIIIKLLTINIVFEFIAGNYNLSLTKELILVPTVTFITLLLLFAKLDALKNGIVIKFLNNIITFIGTILLIFLLYKLITYPEQLFTIQNLKSFLLSPLLTIFFVPFLFFVVIYSLYEQIFMKINRYEFLTKKRKFDIKLAIIKYGNTNLKYLENANNIAIWRKPELQNESKIYKYIRNEIKSNVTFRE